MYITGILLGCYTDTINISIGCRSAKTGGCGAQGSDFNIVKDHSGLCRHLMGRDLECL